MPKPYVRRRHVRRRCALMHASEAIMRTAAFSFSFATSTPLAAPAAAALGLALAAPVHLALLLFLRSIPLLIVAAIVLGRKGPVREHNLHIQAQKRLARVRPRCCLPRRGPYPRRRRHRPPLTPCRRGGRGGRGVVACAGAHLAACPASGATRRPPPPARRGPSPTPAHRLQRPHRQPPIHTHRVFIDRALTAVLPTPSRPV
jgi:hypothetical protein